MNVGIDGNNYSYFEGIGKRGRIYYTDWEFGKFDEQGNPLEATNFIRTKDYIDLGFSSNYTYNNYTVGLKGLRTYHASRDRWHTIYWYDKDNRLLDVRTEHKFEEYKLPIGDVKYKLFMSSTAIPSSNCGEDSCTLRCFENKEPKFIKIKKCNFYNVHGGAVNYTGGQHCILDECYIENSGKKPGMGWAIDYEDGWMNMRGNIIKNSIIKGLVVQVSGNANSYYCNCIDNLTTKTDCELSLIINNIIGVIDFSEKESCFITDNIYSRKNNNTGVGFVVENNNIIGNIN